MRTTVCDSQWIFKMKVSVLLLLFFAQQAVTSNDMIKAQSLVCKMFSKASKEDADNLSKLIIPETPEGKCMAACVGEVYKFLVANKLNKEGLISFAEMKGADKGIAAEVADACAKITHDERCESAYLIWKCIAEEKVKRDWKFF